MRSETRLQRQLSHDNSGLLKLPDFLMTQWLDLKANRRKGIWPIPAKEDAGKGGKQQYRNVLGHRPVTPLEKELRAMVPGWALHLPGGGDEWGRPCQYSSHQERERQLEGILKPTLSTGHLSTSG